MNVILTIILINIFIDYILSLMIDQIEELIENLQLRLYNIVLMIMILTPLIIIILKNYSTIRDIVKNGMILIDNVLNV